jgi:AcrR family transcriptional regulator
MVFEYSRGMMNTDLKPIILEAAARLFARYGFKKTSMDEIAQGAHISKATIYQHFSGKEEVFAVTVRQESEALVQALMQAINSAETHEDKIRAFIKARMSLVAEKGQLHQMSNEVLHETMPLVEEARQAFFNREVRLFQLVLEKGKEAGRFHLDRPRQVALVLLSALKGLDVLLLSSKDTSDIREGVDTTVELFIRGLVTGNGDHQRGSS